MSTTVYTKDPVDYSRSPLFFGPGINIQRYDSPRYPIFEKLAKQQLGYFWTPDEVALTKDRADYLRIPENQKRIFTLNLKYQILLDSVQGRSPGLVFLPFVTCPELEQNIILWESFEMIHSRSYSHIIKNLYPNPNEIFDDVILDSYIQSRATSVVQRYDDFYHAGIRHRNSLLDSPKKKAPIDLKRKLYLAMMSVYILESIRFYVSFACTFAFGENKLMEGSSKIVKLIVRDENVHVALTQSMLKLFRTGKEGDEWARIAQESKPECVKMFKDAMAQEKEWAGYLFRDGSMLGLNERILCSYLEHLTHRRMKAIDLTPDFRSVPNPLTWMNNWVGNSKNVQNAPQETELESYIVGNTNREIDFETLTDMTL